MVSAHFIVFRCDSFQRFCTDFFLFPFSFDFKNGQRYRRRGIPSPSAESSTRQQLWFWFYRGRPARSYQPLLKSLWFTFQQIVHGSLMQKVFFLLRSLYSGADKWCVACILFCEKFPSSFPMSNVIPEIEFNDLGSYPSLSKVKAHQRQVCAFSGTTDGRLISFLFSD